MKPTKTFRMKQHYKRLLANCKTKEMRTMMKRWWISAQLSAETTEYWIMK